MICEGQVTSVFLKDGKRFLVVSIPDPRFPFIKATQDIFILDGEQQQQLGDSVDVSVVGV